MAAPNHRGTDSCTTGPEGTGRYSIERPAGGRVGVQPTPLTVPWQRVREQGIPWWAAMGEQLLATGTGSAVQTAAVPAHADLGGAVAALQRWSVAGVPGHDWWTADMS